MQRWVREDLLGIQVKSVMFMVVGVVFVVAALSSSRWWLVLFGAAVFAIGSLTFLSWRRHRRR